MKKVLSLAGGGMRGTGTIQFLREFESRTGKPIHECFNKIAGTSTGAIIAALAACPLKYTANQINSIYYELGPKVFRKGVFSGTKSVFSTKYSAEALADGLQKAIGSGFAIDECLTNLLIPTVDADTIDAVFIKSWDKYWKNMRLWEAAAASASAQTFFPAFETKLHGKTRRFIDGGNHTNCPAASAYFEAKRLWPDEEILIVHVGTGKQLNPKPLPNGGLIAWAPLVFGTTSECQDDVAKYYVENSGCKSFWFDFTIDRFPGMDDASEKTLNRLSSIAHRAILTTHNQQIKELCNLL